MKFEVIRDYIDVNLRLMEEWKKRKKNIDILKRKEENINYEEQSKIAGKSNIIRRRE
jgi:hypothetical protein